jgi:hypothetical protein
MAMNKRMAKDRYKSVSWKVVEDVVLPEERAIRPT